MKPQSTLFLLLLAFNFARPDNDEQLGSSDECPSDPATCELASDPLGLAACCRENSRASEGVCKSVVGMGGQQLLRPPAADDSLEGLRAQLAAVTARVNSMLDQSLAAADQCCQEPDNQMRFCQVRNLRLSLIKYCTDVQCN